MEYGYGELVVEVRVGIGGGECSAVRMLVRVKWEEGITMLC